MKRNKKEIIMKSKEQILEWLDKQPWKGEFYEAAFLCENPKITYNESFIQCAFYWSDTPQECAVWNIRDKVYQKWYNSDSKPTSWKEYCEQYYVQETDWFIADNCRIIPLVRKRVRDPYTDINVMPQEHCEAFLAYMKLIQLRNAWVNSNSNFDPLCHKIVVIEDTIVFELCYANTNGLSFPTNKMAKEFAETFKDILDIAKPLL